ncbi:MAG: KpsF/GutQ family sugar-phosphate isomerase [Planctomycetota bacterium]|jgi:arabinose-5-phosphate isomerase
MGDIREFGKSVIQQEAAGLNQLAGLLDETFDAAVDLIQHCTGHVVITGVGKPWLIGQKISATMASVGTPSFALHPSEAVHGDLGRLRDTDVVIAMSNSGTSEEITRLVPLIKRIGCKLIGVTSNAESPLAKASDVVLNMGKVSEACPIGMAPSVSTTVLLALGDALSLAVMKARNFTSEDYARFHPGGALGRSLMSIAEIMRPLNETASVDATATVGDALHEITLHKTGAAFVIDGGKVVGVFTDGDLRRHVEDENLLSQNVRDVMTSPCRTVAGTELAPVAVKLIHDYRIGELPVTDDSGKLLGHVALKDLVSGQFV